MIMNIQITLSDINLNSCDDLTMKSTERILTSIDHLNSGHHQFAFSRVCVNVHALLAAGFNVFGLTRV